MTPDHLTELVERHEISVPAPPILDEAATAEVGALCRRAALEWCGAEGLAADISDPMVLDGADGFRVGVLFTVTVGKGAGPCGEPETWTWSVRWRRWWREFRPMLVRPAR